MHEVLADLRASAGLEAPAARARLEGLVQGAASVADGSIDRPEDAASAAPLAPGPFDAPRTLRLTSADVAERLVRAASHLTGAGLPATFLFLFDDLWHLGARLRDRVSAATGRKYELADDVWAWVVPRGRRGWPAHRGVASPVLDRAAPELLNAWIALSDVEIGRACMHFVPLERDPAYPHALALTDVPPDGGDPAPLAAGEALVWNANMLHWGGEHALPELAPRVSCAFSLVRADAAETLGLPLAAPGERVDSVARQIVIYGEDQPDVAPDVLAWARASVATRAMATALSRDRPGP
ncbi:MAG: hypothetical protein JWP97_1896 [Labilithrix sp.]|nr:hypothetical protein [Labilithrix sp.]